jgi:enoyl-CoA hydratase
MSILRHRSNVADTDVLLDLDGSVAIVSNNRPERHNAASDAFNRRLWECFYEVTTNTDVRCVLWRGNGPSFSSGRDLKELGGKRDNDISNLQHIERGHNWTQMLLDCPVPIICALKGWTIGGMFERALLCDLRLAGESTKLWLSEMEHGVLPDSGGVARLFQIAGHGLAADMALTGRVMGAEEAFNHGIVSRVVPDDRLDAVGLRDCTAHRLATGSGREALSTGAPTDGEPARQGVAERGSAHAVVPLHVGRLQGVQGSEGRGPPTGLSESLRAAR